MRVKDGQRHFLRKCNSKNFGLNLVNFSRGHFVGSIFLFVGISWVKFFFM